MTEHEIRKVEVEAFVYSRETPTDEQLKKVQDFLEKKYNAAVAVIPKQDDSVRDGFRIEIGTSTYKWNLDRIFDWSAEGRAKQLKQSISEAIRGKQDVLPMIRQAIEDFEPVPKDEEVGTVLTVGDGIATISGLEDAEYGEILLFECGIKGMILDLKEDEIGCVIFGDESEITEGSMVRRTKKVAGIPVGEAFMGRVINALGEPVDGGVEALIEAPKYKDIRLFYTPMVTSPQPVDTCGGEWKVSSSESVAPFSAAAYFFARDLNDALGVPVGLIQTAWGGTRIEAWMPEATAREVEADIVQTNDRFENPNKVGYLYNAMIRPLLNMTARGFIWYQGESNVHTNNYPHYAHYMEKLVSQWRGDWGDPDMPFYFVQLVPHIYEGGTDGIVLPLMIEQQLAAADRIPNCAMIGTSDMANAGTIHPSEKDQIGRRLALLALTKTYGLKGLIAESPRFESVRFEGGKAILQFKTEGTLGPNYKGRIKGFEIAGADKVFIPARAEYVWGQPYTVVVSSELVSEPVAVRYAFRNVPAAATLTNTGGLPAFPFRTDDWDDVK